MVFTVCVLLFLEHVAADCFGTEPIVFHDMHDGDTKLMQTNPQNPFQFAITPYNNSEKWVVISTFDLNCRANVDFHVPGKVHYPPVNLTATMWVMGSTDNRLSKLGFEWTVPSGTLAPPTQPLNFWVEDHWPKPPNKLQHAQRDGPCIYTSPFKGLVVNDVHDGDKKMLKVSHYSDVLTITPHDNKQSWKVDAKFDNENDCVASVNFDVPGKPNPVITTTEYALKTYCQSHKYPLMNFHTYLYCQDVDILSSHTYPCH